MSALFFDATYRLPLGWLQTVAAATDRLMQDITKQLFNCELSFDPADLLTHSGIDRLERYTRGNREHELFGDRATLIAEQRRVWNLARFAIAETTQAGLRYAERVMRETRVEAAERLRQKLDFSAAWGALESAKLPHPKIAQLLKIAALLGDQKTLVICTTKVGAAEIAAALFPYSPGSEVFQLHGGTRGFEKKFRAFHEARTGMAVATATHEGKLGIVVDTIIHYNLLTPNLQYIRGLTPLPRLQSLLIAADHSLDLGCNFHRPGISPRIRGIAPSRRRRKQKDELTGNLPFPEG